MKSFVNIFINWYEYSLKALLIVILKVGGPFLTLNGITIQTKPLQFITKVVLYLSLGYKTLMVL
jgi:hypothetical protein